MFHGMERIRGSFSRSAMPTPVMFFTDGPQELGGLRYCITLHPCVFVAKDDIEEAGYVAIYCLT